MSALRIFNEYNPTLVRLLPLKDPHFMAKLTQQGLFAGNLKAQVMNATTHADATTIFLYDAIEKYLHCDITEPFDKLLLAMENFENQELQKVANEIKQKVTKNDSKTISGIINCKLQWDLIYPNPKIWNA